MIRASIRKSLTAIDQSVEIVANGARSIGVQITGTITATVTFEASLDGSTWVACGMAAIGDTDAAAVTSASAVGLFVFAGADAGAISHFRARCSAFTSGPVVVTVTASD